MRVIIHTFLSLLFVQLLHGENITDNFEEYFQKLTEMQPVVDEVNASLNKLNNPSPIAPAGSPDLQINPVGCFAVIKDAGIVGVSGWKLMQKRKEIIQKAKEERALCEQKQNLNETQQCLKEVEQNLHTGQAAVTQEMWDIAPSLLSVLYSLLRCVFF